MVSRASRSGIGRVAGSLVALALLCAAGAAAADQHAGSGDTTEAASSAPDAGAEAMSAPADDRGTLSAPAPADGYEAAHDGDTYPSLDVPTRPWAYETGLFFALTRGLDEQPLSDWERRASMVGTVPLDVVMLPTAAIGGLFGS